MFKFIKKVWAAIEKVQEKRAAYWMLQNLSDRELKDIGIGRGQIREVVEGIDVRTDTGAVRP